MDNANVVLDMKGLSCPKPLIGAKRMVDELAAGQVLLLVSNCPGSGRPSSMYSVPPWPSSAWKVALPPMVWFHGSQSRITGGASSGSGSRVCMPIARLAHIMRWVLITALGMPVEPEVNSSLPTLSGVSASSAASTAGVGTVAASSA